MAAAFQWGGDTGAATGSPAAGTTRTNGITEINWKNADDFTTPYATVGITRGQNSFEKFIFGAFSGSYASISNVKFAHTSGSFDVGITENGAALTTYTTPSTASNALLSDITTPIAADSGFAVLLGPTSPQTAGKASSTTSNPAWTQWIVTQLLTSASAAPGDTAVSGHTLQYDES